MLSSQQSHLGMQPQYQQEALMHMQQHHVYQPQTYTSKADEDDDLFDFWLDGTTWKEAFSKPGGCFVFCLSSASFFITRCLIAGVMLGATVGCFLHTRNRLLWFTMLTHWGACIETVYFLFAVYSTGQAIWGSHPDGTGRNTPWFVSVTWALSSVNVVMSCVITVLFWAVVYVPGTPKDGIMVAMHGVNFVLAFWDFAMNRQPYYKEHIFMPLVFSVVYILFTIVFYLAGGKNADGEAFIYRVLDWSKPKSALQLVAGVAFVLVPLLYALTVWMASLRAKAGRYAEKQHFMQSS